MSCVISEKTVELINSNVQIEGTIDEKIQAAFADLAQTAELGNTALNLIEAYEKKIANSKIEIEENKKAYGSIAAAAVDELRNALNRDNENGGTRRYNEDSADSENSDDRLNDSEIINRIGKIYDYYLNVFTMFENQCVEKITESEEMLSNIAEVLASRGRSENEERIAILDRVNELLGTDDTTVVNALMTIIKNGDNGSAVEIEGLKAQIQHLKGSAQKIMEERDDYKQQLLEIQSNEKRKTENLSFQNFDYLFDVLPINHQINTIDQNKDEIIWKLEYQLQEALNKVLSVQKIDKIQIDSLNYQIQKLEAEKINLETKNKLIQMDLDSLNANLASNSSLEIVKRLMTILGCTNENEIFQKINNLETDIKLLKVGNSSNLFFNSNDESEKLKIIIQENDNLKEQIISISNENNINKTELLKLQNQIEQFEKQNKEYQNIINNSEETFQPIQHDQLLVLENEKLKQKEIDLQNNINTFINISNHISSKINEVSMKNHISTKLSNSLQIIFTQFALCQFSDQSINQLISSILNSSNQLSLTSIEFIKNNLTDIGNKYQLLYSEINNRINQMEQQTDNIVNLVINMFDKYEDLNYQINEMLNEDLAPKLSSLTAKYKKLEEENRILRSKQGNYSNRSFQSYSPSTEEVFDEIIHSRN